MGGNMKCEQVGLIGELMQGKELAKQLCDHLISPSSTSSQVTNEVLIEKILSSYEKALTLLNWTANVGEVKTNNGKMMDSHCSFTNGSPRSEVLDPEFKHRDVFKKRKTMPRWTERVKVCSGTALESLEDGYSWRKYGQKDILGAKFPRGYYRCTHRHGQGCQATKQVQKSDEDPMILEITYRGRHTCTQASHLNKAFSPKTNMGLEENKQHHAQQKKQPQEEKMEQPKHTLFSLGSDLEVKIEDLDNKEDIFPSFSFSSPSTGSENEDNIFSETMIGSNFMEIFSPFISPETSESHIFHLSPCHLGSNGLGLSLQIPESDITEIISAPTSVTYSPITDLDLILEQMDFETNFPANAQNFAVDQLSYSQVNSCGLTSEFCRS